LRDRLEYPPRLFGLDGERRVRRVQPHLEIGMIVEADE
jgi:hypothetical protein